MKLLCIPQDKTVVGKLPLVTMLFAAILQNGYMQRFSGNQISYASARACNKNALNNDNFYDEKGLRW